MSQPLLWILLLREEEEARRENSAGLQALGSTGLKNALLTSGSACLIVESSGTF